MVQRNRHRAAAGRHRARRFLLAAATVLIVTGAPAVADAQDNRIDVREANGVFTVSAAFAIMQSPEAALAVLTDYERIPKFMPDVELSRIVERRPGALLVEQQAVSKFMMFSKRVHLMLDVREEPDAVRFHDRCGKSFESYHGSWLVSQHDSLTVVDYELIAKPAFEVPGFVLKRLLKRDANELIERIKAEIANRADLRQ